MDDVKAALAELMAWIIHTDTCRAGEFPHWSTRSTCLPVIFCEIPVGIYLVQIEHYVVTVFITKTDEIR